MQALFRPLLECDICPRKQNKSQENDLLCQILYIFLNLIFTLLNPLNDPFKFKSWSYNYEEFIIMFLIYKADMIDISLN